MTWRDEMPDVRDGLNRKERVVVSTLNRLLAERGGREVPTGQLYGHVLEQINISVEEMQAILRRLMGPPGA